MVDRSYLLTPLKTAQRFYPKFDYNKIFPLINVIQVKKKNATVGKLQTPIASVIPNLKSQISNLKSQMVLTGVS
jgi:hypothetical protein